MAADRKTTGLKALQGLIWHEAYESGAIKGELFRDVPDALQEYRNAGIKTFIYSSGSRKAQADLFGHTTVRLIVLGSAQHVHQTFALTKRRARRAMWPAFTL